LKPRIDLIYLGRPSASTNWNHGNTLAIGASPEAVYQLVKKQANESKAKAWLFWDANLGTPSSEPVYEAIERPGDLWHAGLRLGMAGLPRLIHYVSPTWMLNCDPPFDIEATSWRLSLRACLVRTEVLRKLGSVRLGFQTLEGAGLEMGHRYLMQGVLTRHIPWLTREPLSGNFHKVPLEDELCFIRYRYKPVWWKWCLFRTIIACRMSPFKVRRIHNSANSSSGEPQVKPLSFKADHRLEISRERISVILPTRGRYQYLGRCLETLTQQTLPPFEIICVDQNPPEVRRPDLYEKYPNAGIQVIWQEEKGQSIARNRAIQEARGDWLFFADDDSEYSLDAMEQHLRLILQKGGDGSTGLSLPPFDYTIPKDYDQVRLAYNLDTGNALIRKAAILKVGGFDRNYDFGKGADTDLGIRLYLKGFLLLHNPLARRLHYKAASGGLREYGVLWETRQPSFLKPNPAPTYTYWMRRYFAREKWLEGLLNDLLFGGIPRKPTGRTSRLRILFHYLAWLIRLPLTFYQVCKSVHGSKALLARGPRLMESNQ
jgi:GT2 family glycosyltransferase